MYKGTIVLIPPVIYKQYIFLRIEYLIFLYHYETNKSHLAMMMTYQFIVDTR